MKDGRLTNRVSVLKPCSKRSGGRPAKRWQDCIEDDLRRADVSKYGKTAGRERMTH